MDKIATFEETYPRYPFAELVRLSVALGRRLARWRNGGHASGFHGHVAQPSH